VGQNNYPLKNNPYSNTYNAGWQPHPNFSWSNTQNVQNPQAQQKNFQQGNNYQNPQQQYQAKSHPSESSDFKERVPTILSQMEATNQQMRSIGDKKSHEEEPSPIFWPQQYQEEPSPLLDSNINDKFLNLISEIEKTNPIYTQFLTAIDIKMEVDSEQITNHLKREREEELQSQLVADPNGYYVEDWSSSYHEQAITTLRSEAVVKNQEEEGNEEQIEVTKDLHREKGKELSTEASSTLTHIPALPRSHESSLSGLLDEQTEVIKVEKLSKYSPHSIPVHDSLLDEKLFENSESDLPRSVKIRSYLSVGRIHSLWSKRRNHWCFKFKLKSYYQKRSSSQGDQAHLPRLVVLRPLHALQIHIL
jgi:hypothetical protein